MADRQCRLRHNPPLTMDDDYFPTRYISLFFICYIVYKDQQGVIYGSISRLGSKAFEAWKARKSQALPGTPRRSQKKKFLKRSMADVKGKDQNGSSFVLHDMDEKVFVT